MCAPETLTLSDLNWEQMIRLARKTGTLPRVYYALEKHALLDALPEYAKHHMHSAIVYANAQAQQVRYEVAELLTILSDEEYYPVFLKGAAYVLLDHPVGRGRTFSDIDILVPKQVLSQVEKRLLVYTWFPEPHDEYDQHYYRQWAHEIPPLRHAARGTVADVHHNILPPISGRAPKIGHFNNTEILTKSGARVFSPPALTLHSLVHLFFEEDFSKGFRDLNDLHLFFVEHQADKEYWSELLQLAMETGFGRELFFACRYCEKIFNSPVPPTFSMSLVNYSPTPLRLKLNDWLFLRVLQPDHPLCQITGTGAARFVAMVRGYVIKMPIHILLYHLGHKLYKGIMEGVLGKQKSRWQTEQQNTDRA
ncbi:nucleotidyltransferase family protein [Neptunicella sp. SCSIO 80796]|uniref:nucleotidyltransferase domain-containing protein n=1 Tax=Neptunicella plasticusilytica TaxID=3117012 RepID=UPI003A4DDC05